MKAKFALACVAVAALCSPVLAQNAVVAHAEAKGARANAGEITARATIVRLDATKRTAVLRGEGGRLVEVNIPASVKNLAQVRVGDQVVARYAAAEVVKLERTKNNGIRERIETVGVQQAAAGQMPGVAVENSVEVLATIEALNRKNHTVTLRGVERRIVAHVPDGVDTSKLKVGDMVRAVFVEAYLLDVEVKQ